METLRVGLDKALVPLSRNSVKKMSTEAGDAHKSQWTYALSMQASVVLPRNRPRSHPSFHYVCLRPIARLCCGVQWYYSPGWCDCMNWDDCTIAWDLDCLCQRSLPGPVCHRSGYILQYELDRTGILIGGNDLLCTPPQGLSTWDVHFCSTIQCLSQQSPQLLDTPQQMLKIGSKGQLSLPCASPTKFALFVSAPTVWTPTMCSDVVLNPSCKHWQWALILDLHFPCIHW